MKVAAVVPAAGTGERMQQSLKKPYIHLIGQPVLAHTLRALSLAAEVSCIVVAVSPGDEHYCLQEVIGNMVPAPSPAITVVAGGSSRQESVRKALARVPDCCDIVVIHDGARPLVSPALVDRCIAATRTKRATTVGVAVKDTVMVVGDDGHVVGKALRRDSLYCIQTPQTFERQVIETAHEKARQERFQATDDASLVERLGIPVTVLPGEYTNIKITTQEDLWFAETIMKHAVH